MNRPHEKLEDLVHELTVTTDPVSFLDTLMLVRMARRDGDLGDRVIEGFVQLHDASHVTDGAREILARYLKSCARERADQRTRGTRPLNLRDSDKTVRGAVGDGLRLELNERRGAGFRWEVVESAGPLSIERSLESADSPSTAVYEVLLNGVGRGSLRLLETYTPAPGRPESPSAQRELVLWLVVDPGPVD